MKNRNLLQSFKCAIDGIIYCLRTQKNMRIHALAALFIVSGSLFLRLTRYDLAILAIAISLVISFEMINTAVERTVDLFTDKYHPLAKIAKDAAAGAVLISACCSVFIGYLIFVDRLIPDADRIIDKIKEQDLHIAIFSASLVLCIVVITKYIINYGKLIQGGMPSGHAAVAFSLVMTILMISKNTIVSILSFLLALLVIQSRVEAKIHNTVEVAVGALIGAGTTYVIFKILGV